MPARSSSTSRLLERGLAAAAAAGGLAVVAGGVVVQRRHLRGIAGDPDFRRLSAPLGGRPLGELRSADDTRLHAEVFEPAHPRDTGTDRPAATIVLAHGWTERLSFWGPVIGRLRDAGVRTVAYDLRGHGRSEPAGGGDYALQRFGEDLEAVLAAAGAPPEHTAVAGHSLGAMSIAAWAQDHDVTRRVSAAALINTGLENLIGGALLFGELAAWLNQPWLGRAVLGSGAPLLPFSTPFSQAAIRYIAFGPDAGDGVVAFYERMLMDTPAGVRAATGIALSDLDLSGAATAISVPALVVAGDRDRLTPPAHARRIAATLPRPAGLRVLERTGHMSPLERPEEIAGALRDLIAGAELASAAPAAG